MATEEASDRWFVFQSADAIASRTYATDEVLELYRRGVFSPRTVIHNKHDGRRQAITVGDLAGPGFKRAVATTPAIDANGDFASGLLAGLFCGVLGVALIHLLAKGSETKRGARWGFAVQAVIGIALRLFAASAS